MIHVVYKFDTDTKEWVEVRIFSKLKSAREYIGATSKDTDDMYCIESKESVRSECARAL